MINPRNVFKIIAGTGARLSDKDRIRRVKDDGDAPGPLGGIRGFYSEDAAFVLGAMRRGPEQAKEVDINEGREERLATLRIEVRQLRREVAELEEKYRDG